jgi:hypothetical protein
MTAADVHRMRSAHLGIFSGFLGIERLGDAAISRR